MPRGGRYPPASPLEDRQKTLYVAGMPSPSRVYSWWWGRLVAMSHKRYRFGNRGGNKPRRASIRRLYSVDYCFPVTNSVAWLVRSSLPLFLNEEACGIHLNSSQTMQCCAARHSSSSRSIPAQFMETKLQNITLPFSLFIWFDVISAAKPKIPPSHLPLTLCWPRTFTISPIILDD